MWDVKASTPAVHCPLAPAFAQASNKQAVSGGYGYGPAGASFTADVLFIEPVSSPEGETFYAFTLYFRNSPNSCDGCCAGACLTTRIEFMFESSVARIPLDSGLDGATWQDGTCSTPRVTSVGGCQPTPVRSRTWGSIKGLYR